ncbi:9006_t:CDS:2, partial [Gigaspora margarita]
MSVSDLSPSSRKRKKNSRIRSGFIGGWLRRLGFHYENLYLDVVGSNKSARFRVRFAIFGQMELGGQMVKNRVLV